MTAPAPVETFADVTLANLTRSEAEFVHANTPTGCRAHFSHSMRAADRFMVLVEDLPIGSARDLLAGLADFRAAAGLPFLDVPNWRDVRTGTEQAWREFAETHNITFPVDASRERIAVAVRSWLEKNR